MLWSKEEEAKTYYRGHWEKVIKILKGPLVIKIWETIILQFHSYMLPVTTVSFPAK